METIVVPSKDILKYIKMLNEFKLKLVKNPTKLDNGQNLQLKFEGAEYDMEQFKRIMGL